MNKNHSIRNATKLFHDLEVLSEFYELKLAVAIFSLADDHLKEFNSQRQLKYCGIGNIDITNSSGSHKPQIIQ